MALVPIAVVRRAERALTLLRAVWYDQGTSLTVLSMVSRFFPGFFDL